MTRTLECHKVSKIYSGRVIFKDVSFILSEGASFAITGRNGSGKSTLVKILSGLIEPTKGSVKSTGLTGMLAPYFNVYEELTAKENLEFFSKTSDAEAKISALLERVNLGKRRNEPVRNFSSGMKQRLKLCFALLNSPDVLILDEPRTNLDEEGIKTVYLLAEEFKSQGGILIVATNDKEDLKLCSEVMNVEEFL